jgi:hypothetical protein
MITYINIKNYLVAGLVSCAIGAATTACSDMLESDSSRQVFDPAIDQKTDSVFYALGILQGMQQLADQYAFQGELRGDLVETTTFTDNNLRQLASFTATTACKYDSAYLYYRVINNCNYYIAHRDTTLRTGAIYVAMPEYVGVKAIRAWAYMQLARTYGSVPFYTEPLTQISHIDNSHFPMLDMEGIVAQLAPDLEQYSGYLTPTFGKVTPASGLLPAYLFIPVDIVLGDMYLETGQYDRAASHYVTYLTQVATVDDNHTAYMQAYTRSNRGFRGGNADELPGNWAEQLNGQLRGSEQWSTIFTGNNGTDFITYIPLATSKLQGVASQLPLAYGYDFYSNNASFIDEIQLTPSQSYLNLTNSQDYYYITSESDDYHTVVGLAKLGDTRYRSVIREEVDDNEEVGASSTTTWITKNRTPRVVLYRRSAVLLHLAEAFNRLGMPDAAFAILKDGICKYLVDAEAGAQYITDATRQALKTTWPLLSDANISKFSEATACFGVHTHGTGFTRDFTGSTYQPGLSPYQPDTIIGLKLAELAAEGFPVGITKADSINAMEDILCDEYALELAFEGSRFFDLCRLARHKNQAGLYGSDFGTRWLARKVASRSLPVDQALEQRLLNPDNWYLPFK